MSRVHTGNSIPAIAQEEHEHTLEPATKNALVYGYDGSAKQIFRVDENGLLRSLTTTVIASIPTVYSVTDITINPTSGSRATYGNATITASSTQILALDTARRSAVLRNNSNATVFIGSDNSVTSLNGIPLQKDDSLSIDDYDGAIFGIADATGQPIRFFAELD